MLMAKVLCKSRFDFPFGLLDFPISQHPVMKLGFFKTWVFQNEDNQNGVCREPLPMFR